MSREDYDARISDIQTKATAIAESLIKPQTENGQFIGESAQRESQLLAALPGSIFESAGGGDGSEAAQEAAGFVAASNANAIKAFYESRGRMPDAEILAGAYDCIQNIYESSSDGTPKNSLIAESVAPLSTSEGLIMQDHMAALVLPVMLSTTTNDAATTVPGNHDHADIYAITRIAGSTFGDLTKGDEISEDFSGQYSTMDHLKPAKEGLADGTTKTFTLSVGMPLKKGGRSKGGYIKVLLDRDVVASDNGSGQIVTLGLVSITSGTVDYGTGEISVTFADAPANNLEIHFQYDVDIEKAPELIPYVDHTIESFTVLPHESAISGVHSVQALFQMQREFNTSIHNLTLNSMRQVSSADKDRKRLSLMWFAAKGHFTFDAKLPDGLAQPDHYASVQEKLVEVSTHLMMATKKSGLVGIYAKLNACRFFRSLPHGMFIPAPGYREVPQPHYVGRLFGQYDLYCDPSATKPGETLDDALCFAKGRDYGDAGLVAADAITAVPFKQDTRASTLRHRDTLWDLAYREIHPRNGRAYFTKLTINRS